MADRITVGGVPIVTEDESSGDVAVDVSSLETDQATIGEADVDYQPTRGMSVWNNRQLMASRTLPPMPTFERSGDNPLLTLSELSWNDTDIAMLSAVPTAPLNDPEGDIYLYYSSHDTDGWGLAHADSPDGAWTIHSSSPVATNHRESKVFWNPDAGEMWAYRNTQNQSIHLWTSPNGVSWTDQGQVMTTASGHAGIPAGVIQSQRGIHVLINGYCQVDAERQPCLAFSESGEGGFSRLRLNWSGGVEPTGYATHGTVSNSFLVNDAVPYFGGYLLVYKDLHLLDDGAIDLRFGWTTDGLHIMDCGVALDASDNVSWEADVVADASLVWLDGDLWMWYTAGNQGNNGDRHAIGVAKADFAEVRP